MSRHRQTRRDFLKTSAAAAAAGSVPFWFPVQPAQALKFESPNERPVIGCVGTGSRWGQVVGAAMRHGDVVAVCDVDANHAGAARERVKNDQAKAGRNRDVDVYEDYRKLIERDDIDVVTVVTPDHWHTKICIEALRAGKDIYCEKPLTLTIDEGKQIRKVLAETGRVFQVGTQQRTEMGGRFLAATALVREGRIGDVKRVECRIGGAPDSGPLETAPVPEHLDWDFWLGQAPLVDYIPKRCHYEFRWWYEYSGGKMTDWGAHHVDIAQWAIGMDNSGPVSVEGEATHPVPFEDGWPTVDNRYNTATAFKVVCQFPNGVEMVIRHDEENGILFQGSDGEFFVSRGRIAGEAVDAVSENPISDETIRTLLKGKRPGDHMRNFFECVVDRGEPASDVTTHDRAMQTCHLANIAIRLGRRIEWDPQTEKIVGDPEAQSFQAREQRKGYEIEA